MHFEDLDKIKNNSFSRITKTSKVVLTYEYVDEILKCDLSNESYRAGLSFGAVYYTIQGGSKF